MARNREAALIITPPTPAVTGTIHLTSTDTSQGSDGYGDFTRVALNWTAESNAAEDTAAPTTTRFYTAIRSYSSGDVLVFEQGIPAGANQTNYKVINFDSEGNPMRGGLDDTLPFLQWPAFNTAHPDSVFASTGRVGFSTWRGTFLPQQLGVGPPTVGDMGLTAGPVVVFGDSPGGAALVVSPASHFKGAVQNRWGDDWVAGVSGEVTEVGDMLPYPFCTLPRSLCAALAAVCGFCICACGRLRPFFCKKLP